MNLFATLRRSGGIEALARQTGNTTAAAFSATEALVPEFLACLRDYVRKHGGGESGVQSLLAIIGGLGDGRLAAEVMGPEQVRTESGYTLLEQFGEGKDTVQRLASDAAAKGNDLDTALLEDILPALAMLACGYLSARIGTSGDEEGLDWLFDLLAADKKI